MVLSLMRKHAKSWLIKVLIGIIAVVFVFYFGYSFRAKQGLKAAYVNAELISTQEYRKAYFDLIDMYRSQYKDAWNDDMIKALDLKNRALVNLINQRLLSQEAKRLGLDITENEIQQAIMDYSAFKTNGQFDMGRYRSILSRTRMKPEDFETVISQELLEKKLGQFLFAFMGVTNQEVLDLYTYANEKIKISFVQFKPDRLKEAIRPDQASMEKYFEERKEEYRVPEKINIAYVEIDPKTLREKIEIAENEIAGYYEFNIEAYSQPKQVKARHILFKMAKDATETEEKEVREKAQSVLEKARQGKDFAGLAEKYSEGPSKSRGGDLGYFSPGQMAKPFEDAAFKLKEGEISDLILSRFGYHIIKVEDIKESRTKTLDEVRNQIEKALIANKCSDLAYEKGQTLIDQMPYDIDLTKYAAEHDLEAKHTGYFSQDGRIPSIGGDEKLRQAIFSLEKGESIDDVKELNNKFYILQVSDRKASYLPEMDEVAERVKENFITHLAAEKAKAAAASYLAELQGGKSWDELAREKHLEPQETKFFARQRPIPKIGYEPELQETAFGLSEDKRYPDTVFENKKGSFVIRWEDSEGIDENKYQEEKQKYRFSLMQTKHARLFENWLEYLKRNAEIRIVTPP